MKSERFKKLKSIRGPRSINLAMWGYFCVFAFILIVIVEVVFYIVVAGTFEDKATARVNIISNETVAELEKNPEGIHKTVFRYRSEGVNVYLLDFDGKILVPADVDGLEEPPLSETFIKDMKTRVGEDGKTEVFHFGASINLARVVSYKGQSGYVLVSYSLKIVHETVRTLQLYLIIVGVTVLFVSLLVTYAFSQKITRGLKNMSDTAVKLAEGDYTVKFANADYTEMAQLSDTLNYVRDEVKKSEDFRREILANVTHDLKTPLTMIKAYASMIKEISGDNKEKREKHLQVIIDESDRLTGLVNDVLSVSKLQSNLDVINFKVFNLTELVYGIINRFGYLQEAQGYSFMIDIDAGLYTRADEEKISQVIYNLLGNAANYTGEDKTVYISLKSSMDGKRIKFSVRDTGKGIAKEDLPEIWDRYYRVKENHLRPVKGTGLGLNIVKVILKNHSFDFGVESKLGEGSLFWVDFPAVPAEIEVDKLPENAN